MRGIRTIWYILDTILKLPALCLILAYFGIMLLFREGKTTTFFIRLMNNQLFEHEKKEFFDKMSSAATHLSFILYLTIFAYIILSK